MANTGYHGKISGSVSVTDIRTTFGSSATGVSALCRLSGINKWAKCKPINYTGLTRHITDVERRGMQSDINQGYYYGVKLSDNAFNNFAEIHETSTNLFAHKPLEAGYPARMGDFQGYDHNATADITAIVQATAQQNSYMSIGFQVTPNSSGIPVSDVVKAALSTTGGVSTYIFALLTRVGTTTHACALLDSNPIDLDTAQSKTYSIYMHQAAGDYYLSVFLYSARNSTEVANFPDLLTWTDIGDQLWSSLPIVLPDGYKEVVTISANLIPYVASVTASATTFAFNLAYSLSSTPSSYIVKVSGTILGNAISGTFSQSELPSWAWRRINPDLLITSGTRVTGSVTMQVSIDGGSSWGQSKTFSINTYVQ